MRRLRAAGLLGSLIALAVAPGLADAAIVGSAPSPSYQTNGRVSVVVISGTTAYIGGQFTSVRPAGSAAGTGEVTRNHAAAINLATGGVLPWNPDVSATVVAIYVNGSTVYLGGAFGSVGGKNRKDIAAVDSTTGALITGFKTAVNAGVRAISMSNGQLYVGGTFTAPRSYAASVNPTTGAFNSAWAPVTDGPVDAVATTADGSNKVVLGGAFNTLNGSSSNAIGAVSPTTGASLAWTWHGPVRSGTHPFDVVALTVDSSGVYAAGTGNGGTVIKFGSAGNMIFQGGVDGNAVGVAVMDGVVYVPGHFNVYCGRVMGFNNCPATGVGAATRDKLLALDSTTGALQAWHPAANSSLGTFTIAAGSGYVATGGDFTKLAGVSQQGFGMFKE